MRARFSKWSGQVLGPIKNIPPSLIKSDVGKEDNLPVLCYLSENLSEPEQVIWMPPVLPVAATFYPEDVTKVTLTLPSGFSLSPKSLPSYNHEVRLRFRNSSFSNTTEVSGIVIGVEFSIDKEENHEVLVSVVFTGLGSTKSIESLISCLNSKGMFYRIDRGFESEQSFRNYNNEVIGIVRGPSWIKMEPSQVIDNHLRRCPLDFSHRLTAEVRDYLLKGSESVNRLKVIFDNFGSEKVLERIARQSLEKDIESIKEKERIRIERVTNSLKRKRVIVVRSSDSPNSG